eukprot:scaffold20052_cov191-Amphora_coffeaeformis.AAC.1
MRLTCLHALGGRLATQSRLFALGAMMRFAATRATTTGPTTTRSTGRTFIFIISIGLSTGRGTGHGSRTTTGNGLAIGRGVFFQKFPLFAQRRNEVELVE